MGDFQLSRRATYSYIAFAAGSALFLVGWYFLMIHVLALADSCTPSTCGPYPPQVIVFAFGFFWGRNNTTLNIVPTRIFTFTPETRIRKREGRKIRAGSVQKKFRDLQKYSKGEDSRDSDLWWRALMGPKLSLPIRIDKGSLRGWLCLIHLRV